MRCRPARGFLVPTARPSPVSPSSANACAAADACQHRRAPRKRPEEPWLRLGWPWRKRAPLAPPPTPQLTFSPHAPPQATPRPRPERALSILFNDSSLLSLRFTSDKVYTLGARCTPAAPHTRHKPFSPGTYLTLVLRHAIAQTVDIQSFLQPAAPLAAAQRQQQQPGAQGRATARRAATAQRTSMLLGLLNGIFR